MVSQKNEDGFTVLHLVVLEGDVEKVKSVLDALSPEQRRALIASKDINGKSALDYAVSSNRPDLSALLQSYTDQQTSSALKRRRSNTNTSLDRVKSLERELERETAALSASSAELKELMETAAKQDRLLAASKAKSKLLDQQIARATQEIQKLRKLSPPVQTKHKNVKAADSRSGSNSHHG